MIPTTENTLEDGKTHVRQEAHIILRCKTQPMWHSGPWHLNSHRGLTLNIGVLPRSWANQTVTRHSRCERTLIGHIELSAVIYVCPSNWRTCPNHIGNDNSCIGELVYHVLAGFLGFLTTKMRSRVEPQHFMHDMPAEGTGEQHVWSTVVKPSPSLWCFTHAQTIVHTHAGSRWTCGGIARLCGLSITWSVCACCSSSWWPWFGVNLKEVERWAMTLITICRSIAVIFVWDQDRGVRFHTSYVLVLMWYKRD